MPSHDSLGLKEELTQAFAASSLENPRKSAATHLVTVNVPVLTPGLSSHWLRFVSGADFGVARELVEGLTSDLLASPHRRFWDLLPSHELTSFDDAARDALDEELSAPAETVERVAGWISRRSRD